MAPRAARPARKRGRADAGPVWDDEAREVLPAARAAGDVVVVDAQRVDRPADAEAAAALAEEAERRAYGAREINQLVMSD